MIACSVEHPFPGLRPFEPKDRAFFFGRRREIATLVGLVARRRFVAVLGASGAGKSSLVKAGLYPRLATELLEDGGQRWHVVELRPRGQPFQELAEAIVAYGQSRALPHLHCLSHIAAVDRTRAVLRTSAGGLTRVLAELGLPPNAKILVVVDQFEELFRYVGETAFRSARHSIAASPTTPIGRDEAAAFVAGLLASAESESCDISIIITLRSDFVGECARFLGLPEAIDAGQFLVPRMARQQLQEAIVEPLRAAEAGISPALLQRLLNESGTEPDQLPVLQHALMRTWDEALHRSAGPDTVVATVPAAAEVPGTPGGPVLRQEHYEAAGTMAHAISNHADRILADLIEADSELSEVARWFFRALADIDREGRAVRRPQRLAELVALLGLRRRRKVCRVIERFRAADCSFLVPSQASEPRLRAGTVIDIGHEALLRNWRKIRGEHSGTGWLCEEFEDGLIWRSLLLQARSFGQNPEAVLSPVTTEERRRWLTQRPSAYWARRHTASEQDRSWPQVQMLVHASSESARRARNRKKLLMVGLVAVAAISLVLSGVAHYGWQEARTRTAEAKTLAKEAEHKTALLVTQLAREQTASGYPVTGMQLALHMLTARTDQASLDADAVAETVGALAEGLALSHELSTTAPPNHAVGGHVLGQSLSADGQRIATVYENGTAAVWNVASGQAPWILGEKSETKIRAIALSANGHRVVTAAEDGTVRLWDADAGEQLKDVPGVGYVVALSADGERVVTGWNDVTLWDATSGQVLQTFRGDDTVTALALSADGKRIAMGAWSGIARVWDIASGRQLQTLTGHTGAIASLAMSADGQWVSTGSYDGTARLWDLASGKELRSLHGDESVVTAIALSGDGQRIVTGGGFGTVWLWDAASGAELLALQGHKGQVSAAVLLADKLRIVTAGQDGTVRQWDASPGKEPLLLRGHQKPIRSVGLCPGGRLVLTAGDDGSRLWDRASGQVSWSTGQQPTSLTFADCSAGGQRILTGGQDGVARLWDGASGKLLRDMPGNHQRISLVKLSADGRRIATVGEDGTVQLWDAAPGSPPRVLPVFKDLADLTLSADGQWVVTGGYDDGEIRVWNAASGDQVRILGNHPGGIASLALSADGRKLVTGGRRDGKARLWDVATSNPLPTLVGHDGPVLAVAFSADGQRVVTTGEDDSTVRLWDAGSGAELLVLRGHEQRAYSVDFVDQNGTELLAFGVSADQRDVVLWHWWVGRNPEELISVATKSLPRQLTTEEERRFYLQTR